MKKQHITRVISGIVLGTTLTLTSLLSAADSADPAGEGTKHESKKNRDSLKPAVERSVEGRKLPFHGKLLAVNSADNTITLTFSTGEKLYHITPDTEILKYDQPATLADAMVGEQVSGAYIKHGDRMELTKLNLAKKNQQKAQDTKKEDKDSPAELTK